MIEDVRSADPGDPIHNHPTIQSLIADVIHDRTRSHMRHRSYVRIMLILTVLGLSLVFLAGWDHFLAAPPLAVMG